MALAPERTGIGIRRKFTTPGVHPYDEIAWERRDARISNYRDGVVAFEQLGVEVPAGWSVNATNILAQKYFRGTLGTPEREHSLRQVADRVVDTITRWGIDGGYFVDSDEAETFNAELKHLVVTQKAAFNSPVWFNIGVKGVPQQASACFILEVDDTMDSILNWYREEGVIFKGGSGAGINLSRIRSSRETLNGGGTASGPVSFMRGADASAGTIKSGGKTRRAAKMVILDVDHPDLEDFIWCKAIEERKARVLRDAGFDMDLDGRDSFSIQYQNANNSVRVSDEFMNAVIDDRDWHLRAVITGETIQTVRARDLMRQIAKAAWECADPGMQYDTTINRWHTASVTGRINGSNPCFTGDSLVHTDKGLIRFRELFQRANQGEVFGVYTHDVTNTENPTNEMVLTTPEAFMITGHNPIVRLRFANGAELRCTPGHRIFTANRGYVEARDLTGTDQVRVLELPTPAVNLDVELPVPSDPDHYRTKGDHSRHLVFPEVWSDDFAHYLGWLIGDGSTSGVTTATIYGSVDDRVEVLPRHHELLEAINGGNALKISEQSNGTAQLRLSRRPFKRFLEALGVRSTTAADKVVPWAIEQAPSEVVASFLRGLFDADGCAVLNPEKGSYVGLGSVSAALLRGVQRLLATLGITSSIYQTSAGGASGFEHTRKDGSTTSYGRLPSYDLRVSSHSLHRFAALVGFSISAKSETLAEIVTSRVRGPYQKAPVTTLVERSDDGVELTYNLSEPRNHSYVVNGIVVRNCSEYMHLDNSACNLASLNLMGFLDDDDSFDVDAFKAAVETVFTAQEILVGNADYPTPKIGENSRRFRQLGLGYANLGALLMALGLPYDSADGRALAGAITALMTGHAYATSARTASRMGPFAGYLENREPMNRVLRQHRDAVAAVDEDLVPTELLSAAQEAWDNAVELADAYGVRNSQATVLAPTGTIGLLMDCDTTGIEPDLGLVKIKKLVGGGTMSFVNLTVPRALRRLGYTPAQVESIVAYINTNNSILGSPDLKLEHLPVFACSMGDNTIHYRGHVHMMAAVQPFISGAISKTVNMPEEVTVDEVEQLYIEAWQLGVKAVAIYRDNCKVGQPLSTMKKDGAPEGSVQGGVSISPRDTQLEAKVAELEKMLASTTTVVRKPVRERLSRRHRSMTFKFRVADCSGYVTVGEYDDGRPGELFINVSKQGSTLAGIMDAFSVSISLGLQHGVPLETYVRLYSNMRFEPAGITDDPELRIATSLIDYIFRRLALDYLPYEVRSELGVLSTHERLQPTLPGVEEVTTPTALFVEPGTSASSLASPSAPSSSAPTPPAAVELSPRPELSSRPTEASTTRRARPADAPFCYSCGNEMQRAGSCYVCSACGSTSGCS